MRTFTIRETYAGRTITLYIGGMPLGTWKFEGTVTLYADVVAYLTTKGFTRV